jgi:hypothetical protein
MRLYGAIQKVEPQHDGTVRVHGTATSEAVDDQGEIVRADAIRAAIPEYMRFPALREMHQLSAAGTTLEAEVCEDGTTRIVAHVVDPIAVAKVKNQVYRGFSIGGRVTQREAGNPKTITSLVLNEISLVDRPANPEAIFDCWKAAVVSDADPPGPAQGSTISVPASVAQEPFNSPIQIWACGVPDHRHLTKADALKCLEKCTIGSTEPKSAITATTATMVKAESVAATPETREPAETTHSNSVECDKTDGEGQYADPGYQLDGKKRYPIDTDHHVRAAWNYISNPRNARRYTDPQLKRIKAEIIAAWKEKIGEDGPPSANDREKAARAALTKALWDVGHIARAIIDLDWLREALALEAAIENDSSPQSARLQEIITELCGFLNALVTEEAHEILGGTETDAQSLALAMPGILAMAAGVPGVARVAALLQEGKPNMRKLAAGLLVKAKHSQGEQALLDMAYLACDRCLKISGLSVDKREKMGKACDHLHKAGALPREDSTFDMMDDVEDLLPASAGSPCESPGAQTVKVLGVIVAVLGKAGRAHQHMMDVAHECLSQLTDGTTCGGAAKAGAWHSRQTMEHLEAAHRHLVAAGATCDASGITGSNTLTEEERLDTGFALGKDIRIGDLAKALAGEHAEKAALVKVLDEIVPMLDRLTRRVDDIARTPLPPLTIAKGTVSVSKQQDRGSASGGDTELSPEAIASALGKMSKEEQTLTLIKASYANPIRVLGSTVSER